MHPLVRVKLIKKALEFYSQHLSEEDRQKIKLGMEMVQFGIKNTLVSFQDKYFVYKGSKFIKAKYKGIYRDNGLKVLVGKWNKMRIARWLEDFQSWVNELSGGD
eukprot:13137612-Ditylum_brightwellii.AAC.1